MKRQFSWLIGVGILNLFLFSNIFILLQNDNIYHNTLGKVSENYERVGTWDNFEIKKTSKPYLQIKNDDFVTWDAAIYKCISENMYRPGTKCYGTVTAAFFPLFPILWKLTSSTPISISVTNYFLFIISIALLVIFLIETTLFNKLVIYGVLITLPSAVIYYIPYSEALFLFTMTVATIGIIKKKYGMYFTGIFLLALVRPATVFVLFAILLSEFVIYIKIKNHKLFIKKILLQTLPFLIGYFCAVFIEYYYSGSWTALFEARTHWGGNISFTKGFTDWSIEGFGLSTFALFYICLPAICFLLFLIIRWNKIHEGDFILKLKNYNIEYLFLISIFYLIGILVFTFATQGADLHSFSRYIFASPLFYISVLILLNILFEKPVKLVVLIYFILTLILIQFHSTVDFGGTRFQFSFFGLYMFIATGLFLLTRKILPNPIQIMIVVVLIIFNTVWNTYLLNAFLSNGWIFT